MDKKSKILFWILMFIVVMSIFLTYQRAFITKDYEIIPVSEEVFE